MVNEFREVKLTDSDPDPKIDVALRALTRQTVRVVDADGKPVTGCHASGQMPHVMLASRHPLGMDPPLESAETDVVGLEVESPRAIAFHHPVRNLGGILVLRDGERREEPHLVQLQSCGRIRGRLLDESGQPVTIGQVRAIGLPPVELPKSKYPGFPLMFGVFTELVQPQPDGTFTIENVVPGIRYQVTLVGGRLPTERPISKPAPIEPPTMEAPVVQPGQSVDLGDLNVGDWRSTGEQSVVAARPNSGN
jgi:hypothetical protein